MHIKFSKNVDNECDYTIHHKYYLSVIKIKLKHGADSTL